MFKKIYLQGWRQFNEIDIDLHSHLTIITGANGAGKTTILSFFARHFGWESSFVSTPQKENKGSIIYHGGFWGLEKNKLNLLLKDFIDKNNLSSMMNHQDMITIGYISYDDSSSQIVIPKEVAHIYNTSFISQRNIYGLYIPSHRSIYRYYPVTHIQTSLRQKIDLFQQYNNTIQQNYYGGGSSSLGIIKEALISFAVFGYGNEAVDANLEARDTFEKFEAILSTVLPSSLGFNSLSIRMPEVVLITESGDFSLDSVSGGIASIISMAWHIFMYDSHDNPFVVVIDEPENHLHPELQRNLLPSFIKAFPNAQFIVATHNPFIIGSVPNSNVYVLDYDNNNRVNSMYLDIANRSGTANEILRDVLGLDVTMPIWVEKRLHEITEEFSNSDLTKESLSNLRSQMNKLGLGKYIPNTIARVAERHIKND